MAKVKRAPVPELKTILFLGDTHVGSKYALWPTDRLPRKQLSTEMRRVEYITGCYNEMVQALPPIDLLILMGDLIDGAQRKSQGVGLFTTNLSEQVEAATEILRPVTEKSKQIFRVHGTPYHEDFHGALRDLDTALGTRRLDYVLDVPLPGGILNVAHHPAGGSTLYRGTAVDKEHMFAALAAFAGKVLRPRWIVRAHKHEYIKQNTEQMTVVMCPCFQLPTPYAMKQQYWRYQPTFGCILMQRDLTERGGYRFLPKLFDVPVRGPIKW